uniref:Uncharacterized protein n=1 Tax=Human betaherpesvirus 6 TaxID=10368 RepID=A0A5P9U3V2_9BETA|nr:hypothetical protein [Human betaherpesvirus 6]
MKAERSMVVFPRLWNSTETFSARAAQRTLSSQNRKPRVMNRSSAVNVPLSIIISSVMSFRSTSSSLEW